MLLEKVASPNASDLEIWAAVARLVVAFDSPKGSSTPKTPQTPPKDNSTNTEAKSPVLLKLRENWTSDYLPESLEALQHMIRDNESSMMRSKKQFYAKTLVFVQSSGMGKSRLADVFGKDCPMVNFVLREKGTAGYPPADTEVLSFMRKRLQEKDQEIIMDTPKKTKKKSMRNSEEDKKKILCSPTSEKLKSMAAKSPRPKEVKEPLELWETEDEIFLESMKTTIWNHSIAVGLLQASFEICKLLPLFITTKAQVLIQNNVCYSQCVGQRRS